MVGKQVTDPVVRAAISPCPAAGDIEQRELLAAVHLEHALGAFGGARIDDRSGREAQAADRARIMRRVQLPRQRDVGEIAAKGVNARVERDRGPRKRETLSRAGG